MSASNPPFVAPPSAAVSGRRTRNPAGGVEGTVVVGCSCFRLRRLSRLAARFYDSHLAAAGLKTTQYSLLKAIERLGPVTPGALARELTLDSSTLTRNLRPLLEAGWATLSAGPDGRTRWVSITPAGRGRRQQARPYWRKAQQAFNDCVGNARVTALHALLDRCQADLEAALIHAVPDGPRPAPAIVRAPVGTPVRASVRTAVDTPARSRKPPRSPR